MVAAADELLGLMNDDGVEDVVWFFYPNPMDTALRDKMDVLRPLLETVCANSPVPCHWVDLRDTFEGADEEYMVVDGIPTDAGAEAAAHAIWAAMQHDCVAQ